MTSSRDANRALVDPTTAVGGRLDDDLDAARFRQLVDDPETGRHLLLLLSLGKGSKDSFRRMLDRIAESKIKLAQARARDIAEGL